MENLYSTKVCPRCNKNIETGLIRTYPEKAEPFVELGNRYLLNSNVSKAEAEELILIAHEIACINS